MNIAHTPRPWQRSDVECGEIKVYATAPNRPDRIIIASLDEYSARLNGSLIEAAPDMAEVLIRFADAMTQRSYPELQGIACDAFAALAKAGLR